MVTEIMGLGGISPNTTIIVLNRIIAMIFSLYNIFLNVSFAFSLNGRSPAVWDFLKSKMAAMG